MIRIDVRCETIDQEDTLVPIDIRRMLCSLIARCIHFTKSCNIESKVPAVKFTVLDTKLIVGAAPTIYDVSFLKQLNVRSVINLLEPHEKQISASMYNVHNCLVLPTPDYFSPSRAHILEANAFVCKHNNKTLIHCKSGKGRSVIVAAYILSKKYRMSISDAYEFIRTKRPFVSDSNSFQWKLVKRM